MYRENANSLTVRSCSTNHASGGTIHNVIGGFYHEWYNEKTIDYDVAVLWVCIEFNMAIYIAMYITYVQ